MKMIDLKPENRPYRPRGAAADVFKCKDQEILLEGPAGTGKSRAILEKIHLMAEKYPGFRALILRKTRESLSQSALVTFEQFVVPPIHPILKGPKRNMRQSYLYPSTGAEIVVGGLDKSEKVMSTEYDLAYIQEATEVTEKDWENVLTRLRNNKVPYQQLIADCNPDAPTHWLHQRSLKGKVTTFVSRHEDNPVLFDDDGGITDFGAKYIAKLDALSGARYQRLRLGRWAGAEGQVYENWNSEHHIVDRFEVPWDWQRFWVIDFGYVNPFVWQNWVVSPDNQLILYQEIYRTKLLVEDAATMILSNTKYQPAPIAVICDHDAEDRATLKKHLNRETTKAVKIVSAGIQAVNSRLKLVENGKPRLAIMRGCRVNPPDEELEDAKKPLSTIEEIDGYVWDVRAGQKRGDQPLKEDDHGCDCIRYAVCFRDKISGSGVSLLSSSGPKIEVIEGEEHFYGLRNKLKREQRYAR